MLLLAVRSTGGGSRGTRGARHCCREDRGNGWEPGVRGADEERGDETADGARRVLCREKVGGPTQLAPTGRDQEEDGRAGPPARIPGGPGLDVVTILGIGKVGGVMVTGEEAGSNCNLAWQMSCGGLGGSALGSALSGLHEPGRGDPGGLESYGQQGSRDPKPWNGVALEDASGQCASEVVDGPGPAHAATLLPLDLAWKVPEPV